MANAKQLEILKEGVEFWNAWRAENPDTAVDLRDASIWSLHSFLLGSSSFEWVEISSEVWTDLAGINFSKADLRGAHFAHFYMMKADLTKADLSRIDLQGALLSEASLSGTNLRDADLVNADLRKCVLTQADLRGADLRKAILTEADLVGAQLGGSNFGAAVMGGTIFANSDLSQARGLESVSHTGPSRISIDVLVQSKGKIPDVFLWGCGMADWEIEAVQLYNPELSSEEISRILYKVHDLRAGKAIQFSPLFISYSHADGVFVDKIEGYLKAKGIRFWRDVHDMKAGRIEKQIDQGIRQNPTVLLVLSEHSLASDWVEHEVRTARSLEKEMSRDVLCPVALDDSWKSSRWPKRIVEQITEYNILNFSAWKDDDKFDGMFSKLMDGLELFY
jgi:hypothetical protein